MTYHSMLRAQQEVFDIMPDSKIGMEMAGAFEEAETEQCWECGGHGRVLDYGPFGLEFNGEHECPYCHGSGRVKASKEEDDE